MSKLYVEPQMTRMVKPNFDHGFEAFYQLIATHQFILQSSLCKSTKVSAISGSYTRIHMPVFPPSHLWVYIDTNKCAGKR